MGHRELRAFVLALLCGLPNTWPVRAEAEPPKLLGRCTAADLRQAPYAEWLDAGYSAYTPDPGVVEALRKADWSGVEVTIFFGTWCGDSRREVPRMLKLLDTLDLSSTQLRLVAVDRSEALHKRSLTGEEAGLEIYRVPTLVVSRGGRELGRVVEHPALSLERDLLMILQGGAYQPAYGSFPTVRRWLREGLLADPNISADGLAGQLRSLVSSEWELYSAARVLASRGDLAEATKLMEVDCSLYWESAKCHARLADFQARNGQTQEARVSVVRALERNTDRGEIEALVELVDRTATTPATTVDSLDSADIEAFESELRATETAFAAAFAAGDMVAFEGFLAEGAVFYSSQGPLRGKSAIVESWRRLRGDSDAPPFTWKPERVAVEASGSHGLSSGPVYDPEGRWVATFVSTWQRTTEGWRILLDVGPRCPPAAAPGG